MNQIQQQVAKNAMSRWLSHPQELGKPPAKIECAGEFDLYDLHYYIFKYKKTPGGKWLLGVCGGYEGDETEDCGHIFSRMEEYNEATAEQEAVEMVEMMCSYWKEQAEKTEKIKLNTGILVGLVLLEEPVWDKEALLKDLKDQWDIEDEADVDEADYIFNVGDERDDDKDAIVIAYKGALISVALMPYRVPDNEAEYNARNNYRWLDAEKMASRHKAHLLVVALGRKAERKAIGTTFAETLASCCKQRGVLGIYSNETVYQPEFYADFAGMAKNGLFPLYNLVWFGLYRSEKGMCGYTCGMRNFGYDEMEIVDSSRSPAEIENMLASIASYVIDEDIVLHHGDTIGLREDQKLLIVLSKGVAVEGKSLKIGF